MDIKTITLLFVTACCLAVAPQETARAAEAERTESGEHASSEKGSLTIGQPGSQAEEVTLSDLRDLGLCLVQVKQLSKNIYLEATRTPAPTGPHPEAGIPKMTLAVKSGAQAKFLEPRPEWLVFYVGTLEPIIHLLGEDLKDVHSGEAHLLVPKSTKEQFKKLLSNYHTGIGKLNEHLTAIHQEIGKAKNNQAIATEAVKMFQVAEGLDHDRTRAFALIKGSHRESRVEALPGKPQ